MEIQRPRAAVSFLLTAALVPLAASSERLVSEDWRRRKEEVIRKNPLFGRKIEREELPFLTRVVKAAQLLPLHAATPAATGSRPSIVYLIQGEEDVLEKEASMWSGTGIFADPVAFVLTFRTQRWDALFFPNSILAEGRNVLLAAAAAEEFRRGSRFHYYAMMDADTVAVPPWRIALPRFEAFLADWQPAVGVPAYIDPRGVDGEMPSEKDNTTGRLPHSVFQFDHICLAIHAEAAPALLPYEPEYDGSCNWVSQWKLTALASGIYRDHVLVLPTVRVLNPAHSKYAKDECMKHMAKVSEELRAEAPPGSQSCFPDPIHAVVKLQNVDGKVHQHGSYIPWGHARRKEASVDYTSRTLQTTGNCDDEAYIESLESPAYAPWCRGCEAAEAWFVLQMMTASRPDFPANWNALGVWLRWLSVNFEDADGFRGRLEVEHWWLAAVCLTIASRLFKYSRTQHSLESEMSVQRNINAIGDLLLARGIQPPGDWLFEDGGIRVTRALNTILMAQTSEGEKYLMEGESMQAFVKFLCSGEYMETETGS
eukprot:TRINITY_DN25938_c0_g1_i2.p1 TRINITY_DN25938_c0_g1~~TRINITY_DN25938_c0_g1_i2.p1  ORF type:complete len:540 (-),score=123.64 TRINITY_DN25938_c0_g1_i2:331-1950(-)